MKKNIYITLILILTFYLFFGYVAFKIYNFDEIGLLSLIFLPRTFYDSFILFLSYSIILNILSRFKRVFNFAILLIFPLSIIYLLQFFSLYYTQNYITPEILTEYNAINIYITKENITIIIVFLLISSSLYILLKHINNRYKSGHILISTGFVLFTFLLSFGLYWSIQRATSHIASSFIRPIGSPEVSFIRQFKSNRILVKPEFTNEELEYLQNNYSIKISNSEYPYYKNNIDSSNTNISSNIQNVIIIFAESLSSKFINSYGCKYDSLTPNIDSFAKESLLIKGYYNHTSPTYNGILGSLCSIYPQFSNIDYDKTNQTFKINSLISILNKKQYNSSIFCYENKGYGLYRLMQKLEFKNLYFKQDLESKFNFKSDRRDYLRDKELFNSYISLQNKGKKPTPFIDILMTIETHNNYALSDDVFKYPYKDEALLHAIHNLDYNFGNFWNWFQSSEYYQNTIVVLTADHSFPSRVELTKLFDFKSTDMALFDEISLIIYIPENKHQILNVHTSSIDFAPTILDLLKINNIENNFLGKSIFIDNKSDKMIGTNGSSIYEKETGKTHIMTNDTILLKWGQLDRYLFQKNKVFK